MQKRSQEEWLDLIAAEITKEGEDSPLVYRAFEIIAQTGDASFASKALEKLQPKLASHIDSLGMVLAKAKDKQGWISFLNKPKYVAKIIRVKEFEDATLKGDMPELWATFASKVAGADIERIRAAVLQSGDEYANFLFGINPRLTSTKEDRNKHGIKLCEAAKATRMGLVVQYAAKVPENEQERYIQTVMAGKDMGACISMAQQGIGDLRAIDQKLLKEANEGHTSVNAIRTIKGIDIDAHSKIVLATRDGRICYSFLMAAQQAGYKVGGEDADIDVAPFDKVMIEEEDASVGYRACMNISGLNKDAHADYIIKKVWRHDVKPYNIAFANDVEGADVQKHWDALVKLGDGEAMSDFRAKVRHSYNVGRNLQDLVEEFLAGKSEIESPKPQVSKDRDTLMF